MTRSRRVCPETSETVEKLPESGEVWAGEGFRGELAFAGLALYQLPSRFIRAVHGA
jgi:hypothetical protein